MVTDNPAGTRAERSLPPTWNVQAAHASGVRSRPSKGFDNMKRAIVSAMVAVALLVTGVTVTSFNGISAAHALEDGGDE